jgi:probable selenium-dependent hydroxylase accessory protein YqeC
MLEALEARDGLVCCVGAGGKKSTLYWLASTVPGRVGLTATAHIERFPRGLDGIVADDADLESLVVARSRQARVVAFARPCQLPGRYLGVTHEQLARIRAAAGFDLCLVKADGARNRIIKAPAAREPSLPPGTTTVIPVCSIQAVGRALDAALCHRPERFSAVTGLAAGATVETRHLAALLASPEGSLRGVGDARVVPLINMVDAAVWARLAEEVAHQALAATRRFDTVVLAAMRGAQPLVRVVRR